MIKILKYIACAFFISTLTGCEFIVGSPEDRSNGLSDCSLTALATVGDSLKVRLALTEKLKDRQYEMYEDVNERLRMMMFTDFDIFPSDTLIMDKYRKILTDTRAQVTAITGSGDTIMLNFNNETLNYECGYRPVPGEQISLIATIPDSIIHKSVNQTVMSTVTIPDWQPQVEIVNIRKLYKERQSRELGLLESYIYTDSVAEITFHVVDTSSATHSYRLKALGVSYAYPIPLYEDTFWPEIVTWTSSYFSTDPLLYDSQITDMFGPWQAYTTDIFTNRQFKKEAYITVQVRYPYAIRDYHRFVQIELQPITNSLANYLSAIYRIRVAKQSYYSDYTTLPSNIDGGVGIFGGIGKSTKLRIWLDGEDPNYP